MSVPPQQPPDGFPLTRFLTALAHSPELLDLYRADVARAVDGWNLSPPQIVALEGGNLEVIQTMVDEELGGAGKASVGWWIRVFGGGAEPGSKDAESGVAFSPPPGRLPDWWIRSA